MINSLMSEIKLKNKPDQKVDFKNLMLKVKNEEAKDKKKTIIISTAVISALTVFGVINTL